MPIENTSATTTPRQRLKRWANSIAWLFRNNYYKVWVTLQKESRSTLRHSIPQLRDGAILFAVKHACGFNLLFGFPIFIFFACVIGGPLVAASGCFLRGPSNRSLWSFVVDLYLWSWMAVLIVSYRCAFNACQACSDQMPSFALYVAVTVAILRLLDLTQFQAVLLSKPKYSPKIKVRSLVNTLWHLLEVAICFAIFFMLVHVKYGDNFGLEHGKRFCDEFLRPLYFSMVTIATVGYGDMSPESAEGRATVVLEICGGLTLLSLIFQRAMAATSVK
jgi:hypothetical protein